MRKNFKCSWDTRHEFMFIRNWDVKWHKGCEKHCFVPFNWIKNQLNWTQTGGENIENLFGNKALKFF
jgi:hypothetical protein